MSEQAKNSAPQDNKSNPIGALEQDVKILSAIGYIYYEDYYMWIDAV